MQVNPITEKVVSVIAMPMSYPLAQTAPAAEAFALALALGHTSEGPTYLYSESAAVVAGMANLPAALRHSSTLAGLRLPRPAQARATFSKCGRWQLIRKWTRSSDSRGL